MSDAGRQDFTDKVCFALNVSRSCARSSLLTSMSTCFFPTRQASSALKPNSQKGYGESAKENLDKAAATLQPDSTKSDSQKLGDKVSGSDKSDESIVDKAKNAVGLGDK